MGQFLAIGLATHIGVKKTNIDKAQLTLEQLQEKMKHEWHYVPEIYVVSEQDDVYALRLSDDIVQAQLLSFLHTIYPLLYPRTASYDTVLHTLHTLPPSEWLQWAKGKSEDAFQYDPYGMWDSIEANGVSIRISYESLLLSMEGKIVMEEFGRQFNFLTYTMMHTFREFSIAGALRIYITG